MSSNSARHKICGIMACDPRGVIGKNGNLPWHYPEETAYFRRATKGQVMIMGRKTFESMTKEALNDCTNIIFSTSKDFKPAGDNNLVVSSLEEFLALKNIPLDKKQFMIGGADLARLFLTSNLLDEFLLTKIKKNYDGDVYFPLELLEGWNSQIIQDNKDFIIYKLHNNKL